MGLGWSLAHFTTNRHIDMYQASSMLDAKIWRNSSNELNMLYGKHLWNLRRPRGCLRKFPVALYFRVFRHHPSVSTYCTWSEAIYLHLSVVELRWNLPQIFMTCVAIAEKVFKIRAKRSRSCVQIYECYNVACKYLDGVASRDACFDLCSSYLLSLIK